MPSEKIHMLKTYWRRENAMDVITTWPDFFESNPLDRDTIYNLRDEFEVTGSVSNAPRSGIPVTINTTENQELVAQLFAENPQTSAVSASRQLDIHRRSLQRIMGSFGLKVYIPQLVHGLVEDDGDRCSQFCELFRNQLDDRPKLLDRITWSDESTFQLSGHMNKRNCVYYNTGNQHASIQKHLNQPGVSVWGGFSFNGCIGPIFIDGTLTWAST